MFSEMRPHKAFAFVTMESSKFECTMHALGIVNCQSTCWFNFVLWDVSILCILFRRCTIKFTVKFNSEVKFV